MLYPQKLSSEVAGVLVEAALTIPVLLLVISGIVNIGFSYIELGNLHGAARVGARVASSYPIDVSNPYHIEELKNITVKSVEDYLESQGNNSDDFLISIKKSQLTANSKEYVKVSVMEKNIQSFIPGVTRERTCASAFFVREQDKIPLYNLTGFENNIQTHC